MDQSPCKHGHREGWRRYGNQRVCITCRRLKTTVPTKRRFARGDTYWTGKPCKHGHRSFRVTATGACIQCSYPTKTEWKTGRTPEEKRAYWRDPSSEGPGLQIPRRKPTGGATPPIISTPWRTP